MKRVLKTIAITMVAILLFFIITNPSVKSFKDYIGVSSYDGLRRKSNFFVYSVYSYEDRDYKAAGGNFFPVEPQIDTSAVDTMDVDPNPFDAKLPTLEELNGRLKK